MNHTEVVTPLLGGDIPWFLMRGLLISKLELPLEDNLENSFRMAKTRRTKRKRASTEERRAL